MTRVVFYGFGAYVGAINGQRLCSWWPDDPDSLGWSSALLVPIDLSKTPSAAQSGVIPVSAVQVDDDITSGGLSEVGPLFPLGRSAGACWIRDSYWNGLGGNKPPRQPGTQFFDYELTSVQYFDGELGDRRFYGYHAKILAAQGGLSHVKIWQPGWAKPPSQDVMTIAWLDLAQVSDPNFTTIQNAGDEGALFLDRATAQSLSARRPKIPKDFGFGELL